MQKALFQFEKLVCYPHNNSPACVQFNTAHPYSADLNQIKTYLASSILYSLLFCYSNLTSTYSSIFWNILFIIFTLTAFPSCLYATESLLLNK